MKKKKSFCLTCTRFDPKPYCLGFCFYYKFRKRIPYQTNCTGYNPSYIEKEKKFDYLIKFYEEILEEYQLKIQLIKEHAKEVMKNEMS